MRGRIGLWLVGAFIIDRVHRHVCGFRACPFAIFIAPDVRRAFKLTFLIDGAEFLVLVCSLGFDC